MKAVTKRKVFYIPGYDPMLPRRYRELYRTESAKQATISGYQITLKGKPSGQKNYGWVVDATIDGRATQTDFEFLLWSDIVSNSMERSIISTYIVMLRTIWAYVATGVLIRLMRLQKGPIIAALYPIFMLIVQLVFSIGVAYGVGLLAVKFMPEWIALPIFVFVFCGLILWFKRQDGRFFAYYLMHDYSYSALHGGANPPELEARIADFVNDVSNAITEGFDEVLIVGHSSGAHLGVSVLSDVLRQNLNHNGANLSFLSLGHVVPMVSFLPKADRLRADLNYLCQHNDITWVDVTAPSDGCTFALCDPVSVTGVAPSVGKKWPLVFSAAYTQSLSKELLRSMKWRFFRLHFQYLCAFDRPKDYDYFQITAGALTLSERYKDRPASKSRIETPVSKYTSQGQGA